MIPTRTRIIRIMALRHQGTKGHCQQTPPQRLFPASLLIVAHIDDSLLELPSRDPAVEQDVELAVRAVLELG
jgi:hypothetical protein